jgi:hypothetical protein
MRKFLLAAAAIMMAQPALAAGPEGLACMANSYTPEQQAQLDALLPQLKIENGGADPVGMQMGEVAIAAATECSTRLGWGEAQLLPAVLFEIGRFMEAAFVKHGPMSAEELERIEATLADGDRTALWEALEGEVRSGMTGQASQDGTDNALIYGQFMLEAGFGLDTTKAEQIGILLGAKAMQRFSTREFGAQK